jgi:hypothetical protein
LVNEAFELGLESFVLYISHLPTRSINQRRRNIQFIILHIRPATPTVLFFLFHTAFDFPNGTFELFRKFLPFLLLILGEFFTLVLLTVSTA